MHILANGAVRNLRPTITNHLKIRIMEKNFKEVLDMLTDEELAVIRWKRDEDGNYTELPYENNMGNYWAQFSDEEIEKAIFYPNIPTLCRELKTIKHFRIMRTLHLDCRSQGMMEIIIADRQERYSHVEFISWNNNTLVLAYIP